MKISFSPRPSNTIDLHLIAVTPEDVKIRRGRRKKGAGKTDPAVKAIAAAHPNFKAEAGEIVTCVMQGPKAAAARVGLIGLGEAAPDSVGYETIGGKIVGTLTGLPVDHVFVDCGKIKPADIALIACGARLRAYNFDTYRTKNKKKTLPGRLVLSGTPAVQKIFAPMEKVAEAVHWARDLANEPPNVLYPESYARRVAAKLKPLGVKVTVLDDKTLVKKGFGAMTAVGKASEHLPRLVLLEYKGRGAGRAAPVALVGKGITFDTGGYSIKPGEAMLGMHFDMAGSAAVAGAMMALASTKAPVHAVAALALAENMISDEGYRPTDILTSLSGQTIEVTNTDAEGRLVLCDALWHVQQTYKPRAIVDIATLTGAAMVALGEEYAALFSNDEALAGQLRAASKDTGDKVWPMPLDPAFDKAMDSSVADMKNAASTRFGGSCTAAAFLNRFIQKDVAWAHVDMAPVMSVRADTALAPRGATGFGVRLLADWALKA